MIMTANRTIRLEFFKGHAIYLYRNIEFYKSRSIPWYEDLIYWGMVWLIEILVCMLIKCKINKNFKEE